MKAMDSFHHKMSIGNYLKAASLVLIFHSFIIGPENNKPYSLVNPPKLVNLSKL
jgi:hypothetical protein